MPADRVPWVTDPDAVVIRAYAPRRHVPGPPVRRSVKVRIRHALRIGRSSARGDPNPAVIGHVDPLPARVRVDEWRRIGSSWLSRLGRGRRLSRRRGRLSARGALPRWLGRRCARGIRRLPVGLRRGWGCHSGCRRRRRRQLRGLVVVRRAAAGCRGAHEQRKERTQKPRRGSHRGHPEAYGLPSERGAPWRSRPRGRLPRGSAGPARDLRDAGRQVLFPGHDDVIGAGAKKGLAFC
jgi:hypothetical protein